jgi:NADPH:quinone reductase
MNREATMRAVAVHETGDTPELMQLPMPSPGPGEVLVKLAAASVNPIDVGIAAGMFEGRMPHVFPLILGVDGAGRVEVAGEGVRDLRAGDAVHGQFLRTPLGHGTFADYAIVPEVPDAGALQLLPDVVPVEIAAALPTAGMTAIGAIEALGLRSGQSVLITGATGGVGVFAVQLAAARGLEVIATARPDADGWIRDLGASSTVDYMSGDITGPLRQAHPGGLDAVLGLNSGQDSFTQYAGLVRDGGAALSIAFAATPELLASGRITTTNYMMKDKPGLLARITAEAAAGRVTVPIQRTVTLEQTPDALAALAAGGARGKTVVLVR